MTELVSLANEITTYLKTIPLGSRKNWPLPIKNKILDATKKYGRKKVLEITGAPRGSLWRWRKDRLAEKSKNKNVFQKENVHKIKISKQKKSNLIFKKISNDTTSINNSFSIPLRPPPRSEPISPVIKLINTSGISLEITGIAKENITSIINNFINGVEK